MTVLTSLTPRIVEGPRVEPAVEFTDAMQAAGPQERCLYTCGCSRKTRVCVTTGATRA